jgi:hypothetical protein
MHISIVTNAELLGTCAILAPSPASLPETREVFRVFGFKGQDFRILAFAACRLNRAAGRAKITAENVDRSLNLLHSNSSHHLNQRRGRTVTMRVPAALRHKPRLDSFRGRNMGAMGYRSLSRWNSEQKALTIYKFALVLSYNEERILKLKASNS